MPIALSLLALFLTAAPSAQTFAADRYVAADNPNSAAPFTNWFAAASNIQQAVDAASNGETIWVTNGVYATGGVTNYPAGSALTNRVAIYKPITVRSVNGPGFTVIQGVSPIGYAAVRGVECRRNN